MKPRFKSSKSFEDSQKFTKAPRVDELVDMLNLQGKEWKTVRPVGPLAAVGGHWLSTEPPDPKKKTKAFYKQCLAFNPETESRDSTIRCRYCEDESGWIRPALDYFQNMIDRQIEEDKPSKLGTKTEKEEETGFKEKGSKAWTPMRVARLTANGVRELKKLSALNRHTVKKTGIKKAFPLNHTKYGMDVELMYDPDEKVAAKKFSVQRGEPSALTEEQQEYLAWDVESLFKPEKPAEAEAEYKRWLANAKKKGLGESETSEEEDDEDRMPKKSSKDSSKAKAKARSDDDEDDEDDEDNEFPSDKKSKKSSKKRVVEDEDDEDDEDNESEDDDDEEDDDPPPRKKSTKKPAKSAKSKKSARDEDDEDEDEDEDDDD